MCIRDRRNPGKGNNKVVFGGIFAEAWSRAGTVGNAVTGFNACGIQPFNPNRLPEHVFFPGTVHEEIQKPLSTLQQRQDAHNQTDKTTIVPQDTADFSERSFQELSPVP